MTGPLLRTGSLKAFHPLGAVGNPVYLAASQLRAAISRRLGAEVADTFALPQRNEDGDTIDWYAAQSGPVVPWSAATADERARAQERLLEVRSGIEALAGAMRQESDGERQVFGRLLEQVTRFPDDEHVYLVNDAPVVTFWGFLLNDAAVGSDPLLNLDLLDPQPAAAEVPSKRGIPWWLWLLLLLLLIPLLFFLLRACQEPPPPEVDPIAEAVEPWSEGQPPVDEVPGTLPDEEQVEVLEDEHPVVEPLQQEVLVDDRVPRRVEVESGRVAIEAGDSVTGLRDGETQVSSEQAAAEAVAGEDGISSEAEEEAPAQAGEEPETGSEAAEGEPPVEPGIEPGVEEAAAETGAPEANEPGEEQGDQPPAEAPQQDEQGASDPANQEAPPTTAVDPNATDPGVEPKSTTPAGESLTIPSTASGSRSTRFLNGGWQTATSLQDPKTGLPINLEYQLKDGAGKVRLKRHDGSTCEGGVKAGLTGDNLVIDSTGNIVCADGTNFGRPKLECKPGADGKADCQGRYPGGESFSVDMNKQGPREAIGE